MLGIPSGSVAAAAAARKIAMSEHSAIFAARGKTGEIETGTMLMPGFDFQGLIPAVATDAETGEILMLAYMNAEALARSLETGEAHYFSRSRQRLWRKGETSGHIQKIREMRIDCDQDAIWLKVEQMGAGACHVGYKSCFYRRIRPVPQAQAAVLETVETPVGNQDPEGPVSE